MPASAQTREATISEITLRGTVQAIDRDARTVTILGDKGRTVTLDVPASATRFEQVKVGDIVTLSYYDRVAVRLKAPGEPPVDRWLEPTTTTTPGTLPGATRARQRTATVAITAWDPATRMITFTGPRGGTYTRQVSEAVDPAVIKGLKIGDRADLTWTEALSLQVSPGTTPEEDFRHRFTVSLMFGVDNQFSGKMIKESTGSTTGGQAISLDETTFDEVYGRIAMLKIGVGYRTTPRTDVVLNYVWSKSDADDSSIAIGAAGTVPLNVNFTEYKYWGFEGGQRWYFARTRFTPFFGYLVGINRHQDIRGTFVDVPISSTPGLAEADGKFFEKSWALSLGPTGGILIGVGPIEVLGELQLRYVGGLSDVDWLVEEGLRDINDESGRWSIPVLVGARIRF